MTGQPLDDAFNALLSETDARDGSNGTRSHAVAIVEPEDLPVPLADGRLSADRQLFVNLLDQNLPLHLRQAFRAGDGVFSVAVEGRFAVSGPAFAGESTTEMVVGDTERHLLQESEDGVRGVRSELAEHAATLGTDLEISVLDQVVEQVRGTFPVTTGSSHHGACDEATKPTHKFFPGAGFPASDTGPNQLV